jgi:hypothetical protein
VAGYYRYNPRRLENLVDTRQVRVARVKVHESALRRIQAGHDGYAPITLPQDFAVVRIDGTIVDADTYLGRMKPDAPAATAAATLAAVRTALPLDRAAYAAQRETVYNTVWRRRIAYFATLAVTLALLAMPLFASGTQACAGVLCVLTAPIAWVGSFLPALASPWIDSFSAHPGVSLPLMAAIAIGIRWGRGLEARIPRPDAPRLVCRRAGAQARERDRHAASVAGRRRGPAHPAPAHEPVLHRQPALRHAPVPARRVPARHRLCRGGAPPARCATPCCPPAARSAGPRPPPARAGFDVRAECWSTGVDVHEGATYRVRLTVAATQRWRDASIPAGPHGFECPLPAAQAVALAGATLLRRHLSEPWFQPIARIGTTGNDTYALRGEPRTAPLHDRCETAEATPAPAGCPAGEAAGAVAEVFESVLVARSSGPLFLYVNDAVDVPLLKSFYANNAGCAKVEVIPVMPAPSAKASGTLP